MKKRTARRLTVDPSVATALLRIVTLRGRDPAPTLDVASVVAVEKALQCVFTDNVLACFAARAFELDDVVELTRTARQQGLPDGYVAVWRFRRKSYVLVPKRPENDDPGVFVLGLNDNDPSVPQRGRLVYWLEQIALREGAGPDTFEGLELAPALVEGPPKARSRTTSHVVEHAKFGRGEVVREEGGKVVVRFGDGVERTLLASVVARVR